MKSHHAPRFGRDVPKVTTKYPKRIKTTPQTRFYQEYVGLCKITNSSSDKKRYIGQSFVYRVYKQNHYNTIPDPITGYIKKESSVRKGLIDQMGMLGRFNVDEYLGTVVYKIETTEVFTKIGTVKEIIEGTVDEKRRNSKDSK